MKTGKQLFSGNVPEGLPAEIKKVEICGYTQRPIFLILIPSIDYSYWTHESNLVTWKEGTEFTERELQIFKAANLRAEQLRKYFAGEPVKIDSENPLKQFPELN